MSGRLAQFGSRALAFEARCHRFKSGTARQTPVQIHPNRVDESSEGGGLTLGNVLLHVMPPESPIGEQLTDQFELYMTLDANGMYDELTDESVDEEFYAPGYGIAHSSVEKFGINSVEDTYRPIESSVSQEPQGFQDDPVFCWHQGVMDQLEPFEEWFDRESIYDYDERGSLKVIEFDVPVEVTLERAGGVTVVLDYAVNRSSVDDYMFRAQLFYGGPWDDEYPEHPVVTVQTEHLPETYHEALGVIEALFANNPLDDFTLCLFEEDNNSEDTVNIEIED